jgi:Uma2 family endonuclease
MLQTLVQPLTLENFLQLPETEPGSEFIDGQIIQKPMPQGKHSAIQMELGTAINAVVRSPKIARAFPELRCTFSGKSIIPDLAVFTWDRIPREEDGSVANVFAITPDWIIEILSPDQTHTKIIKKILSCLENGTQMGWLIDPQEQGIFVYLANHGVNFYDEVESILPTPKFAQSIQLTVGQLFSWLSD